MLRVVGVRPVRTGGGGDGVGQRVVADASAYPSGDHVSDGTSVQSPGDPGGRAGVVACPGAGCGVPVGDGGHLSARSVVGDVSELGAIEADRVHVTVGGVTNASVEVPPPEPVVVCEVIRLAVL
jgi:hypothetical protein